MVPELVLWQWVVVFAIGAAALVRSGVTLAGAGDEIAERTGLGGLVVGILLVSFATSMPELVTDISAAAAGAPDLALGDLFGSSMANMAILAVVDLVHRGRVWPRIGVDHARVAAVAIALTAMAVLAPPPLERIGDVTGAGDGFAAGFLHARLHGGSLGDAVAHGAASARLALASEMATAEALTRELLADALALVPAAEIVL